MPLKRNEMVEIDRNEFIFGEEGGRGTPASTYFRKISSMASSGRSSPSNNTLNVPDAQPVTIGAGRSHAEFIAASQEKQLHSKKKSKKKFTEHKSASSPGLNIGNTVGGSAGSSISSTSGLTFSQMPRNSSVVSTSSADNSSYFDLDDDWDSNFDTPSAIGGKSAQLGRMQTPDNEKPGPSEVAARAERDELNSQVSRILRFQTALASTTVDVEQLRNLSWSGVPADLRPCTWMHLLGYLPPTAERRPRTLQKKRDEYITAVKQVFDPPSNLNQSMWHQITIDIPRTNPHIKLYSYPTTQRALERVLYLWAIRHPASGYVQGINDLVTPFFQTFLTEYVGTRRVEDLDPALLRKDQLDCVEADSYWCLSKLLDGIQDSYIHAQPGIHRQVALLEKLVTKIDEGLVKHFQREGIEFMQFSFRWMNCLLMREVPMNCAIRMWDTYLAEGSMGFSDFHVYVCAAFLAKWSKELKGMDFQDLMIFLQSLPTDKWAEKDIELVLSSAFMYQSLFKDALK